jgi:hypothetical protein
MAARMLEEGVQSAGTLDIGRIAFAAPSLRIVDLGGLTDPEVAGAPGDFVSKQVDVEKLERRAPDAFLFAATEPPAPASSGGPVRVALRYPVERDLVATAWFRARYRVRAVLPIRSEHYLVWYERLDWAEALPVPLQ